MFNLKKVLGVILNILLKGREAGLFSEKNKIPSGKTVRDELKKK